MNRGMLFCGWNHLQYQNACKPFLKRLQSNITFHSINLVKFASNWPFQVFETTEKPIIAGLVLTFVWDVPFDAPGGASHIGKILNMRIENLV